MPQIRYTEAAGGGISGPPHRLPRTPISEISALPPKRNGRNMCANTNFETGERRFDSAHSNTSISGPHKKFRKIGVDPTVYRPDSPKYLVSCRHRTKKQMKFSPNFGFQGFDRREILACCPLQLSAIVPLVNKYVHSHVLPLLCLYHQSLTPIQPPKSPEV